MLSRLFHPHQKHPKTLDQPFKRSWFQVMVLVLVPSDHLTWPKLPSSSHFLKNNTENGHLQ